MSSSRSVAVVGATGLVGRECVRLLLADRAVERVVVIARRTLAPDVHARKLETHVVAFDRLGEHAAAFAVDAVICALGTTMKQAGTQERFRRVDYEYPLIAARLGRERGVRHFLLVSALGADARSRVFYNRVKGELEEALRALAYPSLTIVRPSLLLGARHELRPLESLGKLARFLPLGKYKPVTAAAVAAALVAAVHEGRAGHRVIESSQLGARI